MRANFFALMLAVMAMATAQGQTTLAPAAPKPPPEPRALKSSDVQKVADLGLYLPGPKMSIMAKANSTTVLLTLALDDPTEDSVKTKFADNIALIKTMETCLHATKQATDTQIIQCKKEFEGNGKALTAMFDKVKKLFEYKSTDAAVASDNRICSVTAPFDLANLWARIEAIKGTFQYTMNVLDTQYNLNENGKPTTGQIGSGTFTYCATASQLQELIGDVTAFTQEYHNDLNSLSNAMIPAKYLSAMDDKSCVAAAKSELSFIEYCLNTVKGLQCIISVQQRLQMKTATPLVLVPFLSGKASYVLDLGMAKPFTLNGAPLVADLEGCTTTGNTISCPDNPTFLPSSCLEADLARDVEGIVNYCDFSRHDHHDPLVFNLLAGQTLVAQRSEQPLVLQLGDVTITEDPVLIEHSSNLLVVAGNRTSVVPGDAKIQAPIVHTFAYNATARAHFADSARPLTSLLRKLIPETAQEIIVIILAVAQASMAVPAVLAIRRYCAGASTQRDTSGASSQSDSHERRGLFKLSRWWKGKPDKRQSPRRREAIVYVPGGPARGASAHVAELHELQRLHDEHAGVVEQRTEEETRDRAKRVLAKAPPKPDEIAIVNMPHQKRKPRVHTRPTK